MKFAERKQRGERKNYALHFVDRKNATQETESHWILLVLCCLNAMVDRDVMDHVIKNALGVRKLMLINN